MSQQQRAVLITGAGGGLGRALSLTFARAGYSVAVNYGHSLEDANQTAEAVRSSGAHAHVVQADVADDSAVRAMVDQVITTFGGLDVLVNNAGMTQYVRVSDLDSVTDEHWDRLLGVNLKGPFYCARAVAPHLRERRGSIVNVASVSAFSPIGSSIPYMASKAGLVMLTRCLAQGLGPDIRTNAVAPGWLDTPWWDKYATPEVRAVLEGPGFPPAADLDDISRAVLMLAETPSINGQTLVIDRGQLMR